jgi:hypothetical protein
LLILTSHTSVAREQISQGKARDDHSIYPPHLRSPDPDDIGLQVFNFPNRFRYRLTAPRDHKLERT